MAMIAASGLVIWIEGIPLTVAAQRVFAGLQSFPLLAVPLFTLAGSLMNESGISERLFSFTRALVGHIRGGLAQTAVVGDIFLSGISGSSIADTAATARVLVPQLERNGYSREFGAALAASVGTLGPIIPPSILMVLYAWQSNVSLGASVRRRHRARAGNGGSDVADHLRAGAHPQLPDLRQLFVEGARNRVRPRVLGAADAGDHHRTGSGWAC